jgi:hypothetical protein
VVFIYADRGGLPVTERAEGKHNAFAVFEKLVPVIIGVGAQQGGKVHDPFPYALPLFGAFRFDLRDLFVRFRADMLKFMLKQACFLEGKVRVLKVFDFLRLGLITRHSCLLRRTVFYARDFQPAPGTN